MPSNPRSDQIFWERRTLLRTVLLAAASFALIGAPPAHAEPNAGQWDPTLPNLLSAGAPGDPVAIANASLQASAYAAQTTFDMGRKFLGGLGLVPVDNSGAAPVLRGNRVYGRQAVEYVIRRAGTQIGVPYSWGGGSLTGPSRGVDSGAGTVGFDCSGLTRYAFAGVGVLLPAIRVINTPRGANSRRHRPSGATSCSGDPAVDSTRRSISVTVR